MEMYKEATEQCKHVRSKQIHTRTYALSMHSRNSRNVHYNTRIYYV